MAKVAFTAGRVAGFKCPTDKAQAFLWDSTAPGLGLRTTPAGAPAFVFQGRYQDKTIRLTIGSPSAWSIPDAQAKARELQRLIDEGKDPRTVKAEQLAKADADREAAKLETVTVGEAWAEYMKARRAQWGERHYRDHERMSQPGGVEKNRGTRGRGVTIAGPVYPLLALRLVELTPEAVEAWAAKQAKDRPTYGRLAWRCIKVFLGWCAEQPEYRQLVHDDAAKTRKTREAFGKPTTKQDALQREQLPVWFAAVRQIGNPVVAAALQTMLLTGARPGEVLSLRWADVNTQWKGLTIRDKVEGERVIPLTPYVAQLLAVLPKRNRWVFSSATAKDGALTLPRNHHVAACKVAGLDGLTLHGLRRSFSSLTEWLEIPSGVVAQIMGHKPSATAEKHYKVRPLDLLRLHHERIEAWILEQGKVPFVADAEPGKLRVVASA
nr:site-specific integrase [uncultured Limnohabitans sp.]